MFVGFDVRSLGQALWGSHWPSGHITSRRGVQVFGPHCLLPASTSPNPSGLAAAWRKPFFVLPLWTGDVQVGG